MTEVARGFRKAPTPSEAILWRALRGEALDGRKFRRQQPIGPFIVDFYCSTERLIVEDIRRVSRGVTTLLITHRLPTAAHADQIVVLDDGRIVEIGTHAALLRRDDRYAALWRAQAVAAETAEIAEAAEVA